MNELEGAGYTITQASEGVLYVEGYGLAVYVAESDADAIAQLVASPAQQLAQLPEAELRAQAAAAVPYQDTDTMTTDHLIDAVIRAAEES